MEGQDIFSGMILVIAYLAGYGPEVAMDVEEIHVYGYLDAILLKILLLKYLVHNHHLAVCYGGYQPVILFIRGVPVGNPEEPGDEYHKHHHNGAQRDAYPQDGDETCRQEYQHGTDAP